MLIRNRQDLDLNRCKPYRESTCIVLDQDADEALDAAIDNTMDHDRTMLLSILTDISQIEFLRHEHIELDRTALPGTANGISEVEIDLRTIESTIAFIDHILQTAMLQSVPQSIRRRLPYLIGAHGIFRARTELCMIFQTECLVDLIKKIDDLLDLFFNLRRHHEDMRIILRKVPYAEQSMERTGKLMTMDKAKLAHAQRQFTIAVLL